jgi:hypothetical protein
LGQQPFGGEFSMVGDWEASGSESVRQHDRRLMATVEKAKKEQWGGRQRNRAQLVIRVSMCYQLLHATSFQVIHHLDNINPICVPVWNDIDAIEKPNVWLRDR